MGTFTYAPSQLSSLERSISPERIGTYLRSCGGDLHAAILMYEKNIDLSEAFYGVLQTLEITLRNSMHRELTSHYGAANWFDSIEFLRSEQAALERAKKSLSRNGKPVTPGRVIAELPFGFWAGLTSRPYSHTIWIPSLHRAFPCKRLGHRDANRRLEEIRKIRNRVAHHEPIIQPTLGNIYRKTLETLEWICPDTALWMRATTRFETVYCAHMGRSPC